MADVTARDRDGELIAVPTEWDEEAHGSAPKIHIRTMRKSRPGEVAGVGDRALLRVEKSDTDDEHAAYAGRVIKILDRAKQRTLGIFRALPGGGGRLSPIDKNSSAANSRSRRERPATPRMATSARSRRRRRAADWA